MASLPEHDDIADILIAMGVLIRPADVHGFLTGLLAVSSHMKSEDIQTRLVEFLDGEQPDPDQRAAFDQLWQTTRSQLQAGDMQLELLLPDDYFELEQRVANLAAWCQGFLQGFALAGHDYQKVRGESEWPEDISELVNDLVKISQLGDEEPEDDAEAAEMQLFEVQEYVRIAVLNIYTECHAAANPSQGSKRIH